MPNLPPFLAHQVVLYLTRSQSLPANPRHYRPSVARPWLSSSSTISPTWEPSQALPKVFLFPIEPTPSQPSSYPMGHQSKRCRHLARSSESCQPPSISLVARLQATKHYHRPCVLLPMVTAVPCRPFSDFVCRHSSSRTLVAFLNPSQQVSHRRSSSPLLTLLGIVNLKLTTWFMNN